jgi:hypothetical protein
VPQKLNLLLFTKEWRCNNGLFVKINFGRPLWRAKGKLS